MKLPAVALVAAVSFRADDSPAAIIPERSASSMTAPPSDPADEKVALRKQAATRRRELTTSDPDAAARLAAQADIIAEHTRDSAKTGGNGGGGEGAAVVAAYMPIRSELSPLPLVTALIGRGLVTAMPETPEPGQPLVFRRWAPGEALVDGPYGTQQPPPTAEILTPGVVLAPMLAFDAGCRRLGYGGGFYDRTLGALRAAGRAVTAIGIAFDGQLVDKVPVGPYDIALDAVLTPSGLRWADNQQPGET